MASTCKTVTGTGVPSWLHSCVIPSLTAITPVLRDSGIHCFLSGPPFAAAAASSASEVTAADESRFRFRPLQREDSLLRIDSVLDKPGGNANAIIIGE